MLAILAPKLTDLTGRAVAETACPEIGDIDGSTYCGLDSLWHEQSSNGVNCINNFECLSGACYADICMDDIIGFTVTDDSCETDADCTGGFTCQNNQCASPPVTSPGSSGTSSGSSSGGGSSRRQVSAGICVSNWTCSTWSACIGGKKSRTCTDINDCDRDPPVYDMPAEEMLCVLSATPSCNDGILNQGEENADCGGPCAPCNTCFDNEQNCHDQDCELGLDCGGPCMPCKHALPIILVIITILIALLLIGLGIWYWRIKASARLIGETVEQVTGEKIIKAKRSFRL